MKKVKFKLFETDLSGKEKQISEELTGEVIYEEDKSNWIEVTALWNGRFKTLNIKKNWVTWEGTSK